MNYDQLVKEWAAEKAGVPVEEVEYVQFGDWVGCYSSWTCDFGIDITVKLSDGTTKTFPDWNFPEALKEFSEWVEAHSNMMDRHDDYHGGY